MLYVRESLGDNEKVIHVGVFHWTYTFWAVMNAVIGILIGIGIIVAALVYSEAVQQFTPFSVFRRPLPPDVGLVTEIRNLHPGIRLAGFISGLLGLLGFAHRMIVKATTEIAVTTHRVISKRGIIARYVEEISVDRIEGANVFQSFFGRILNYGRVSVRGMGVGEVLLPIIDDPITFRKAVDKARAVNRKMHRDQHV